MRIIKNLTAEQIVDIVTQYLLSKTDRIGVHQISAEFRVRPEHGLQLRIEINEIESKPESIG